jgi:hypothetical protein
MMATVPLTTDNRGNVQHVKWTGLTTNDYGQPWEQPNHSDKTFSIIGDFGSGATVVLQGSNVWNPVLTTDADWHTLTDTTETDVSVTSKTGGQILQNYRWIRPKVTGGTSPDLDVYICAARAY